jgi:hypothetical protein
MNLAIYLLAGWFVLLAAIILNLLADRLGITGWYGFLTSISVDGPAGWKRLTWVDHTWLFFVYPLSLGAAARAGIWLSEFLLRK